MTAVVAGMSALLAVGAAGAATPALAAPGIRTAAHVPTPGQSSTLTAVKAITRRDAWAVGYYCPSHCKSFTARQRYMILHWNGKTWSVKRTGSGTLEGISATGARNVWAVGARSSGPLFLHWNGKAWSRGKTAALPPTANFASLSMVSPRNGWAVGSAYSVTARAEITLVAHWNGRKWSRVPAPHLAGRGKLAQLATVSADTAKDAWAAGSYCASACQSRKPVYHAAILHWNGHKWSRSRIPGRRNTYDIAVVQALSRSDAWAIGDTVTGNVGHPLMLRWNGSRWRKVTSPIYASAMTFMSPSDGWIIGLGEPTAHWNGKTWKLGSQATPNWGGYINSASGDAANDVWVVGERCAKTCTNGIPLTRDVILHWNGHKWSVL